MYDKGEGIKRSKVCDLDSLVCAEAQTPIGPVALALLAETSGHLATAVSELAKQLDPILNVIEPTTNAVIPEKHAERWPPLFSELRSINSQNRDTLALLKSLIYRIAL